MNGLYWTAIKAVCFISYCESLGCTLFGEQFRGTFRITGKFLNGSSVLSEKYFDLTIRSPNFRLIIIHSSLGRRWFANALSGPLKEPSGNGQLVRKAFESLSWSKGPRNYSNMTITDGSEDGSSIMKKPPGSLVSWVTSSYLRIIK